MRVEIPSLDAAAHMADRLDAANEAARIKAQDITSARFAAAAIKAIGADFTPAVAAQLCAVLSSQIASSGWGHWTEAIDASECLDSAHDRLTD